MQSLTVGQHGHAARTDKHLLYHWSLCSMVFDGIAGKFKVLYLYFVPIFEFHVILEYYKYLLEFSLLI